MHVNFIGQLLFQVSKLPHKKPNLVLFDQSKFPNLVLKNVIMVFSFIDMYFININKYMKGHRRTYLNVKSRSK